MTNRWRRFVWLSIGIDYQYQLIDELVSIGMDKKLIKKFTNREYLYVVTKEDPQAETVGG